MNYYKLGQKIAVSLFALLLFDSVAQAKSTWIEDKLKVSGHFRIRETLSSDKEFEKNKLKTELRVRPKLSFKVSSKAGVVFEPQMNGEYGERSKGRFGVGTDRDNNVTGHQGYVYFRPWDNISFTAGRRTLSYGDQLILGAGNWAQNGNAFDQASARYSWGNRSFTDLFVSQTCRCSRRYI